MKVDRITHSRDYSFEICGRVLDLVKPEVGPFDPPTQKTLPWNQTWSGSDDRFRIYRRYFLAHAHFRHISTSGGSSCDGFRIADRRFLFMFNSDYGSIWLSFRDMVMGQTYDRRTTPLLKVSHLLLQANHLTSSGLS